MCNKVMKVTKRNGSIQDVDFNKITNRLKKLCSNIKENIDVITVAQKVCVSLYDNVTTRELDTLSSEISMNMSTINPGYGKLASNIVISDLHKNTKHSFKDLTEMLYVQKIVSKEYYQNAIKNIEKITHVIDYDRDYKLDFFGFKTLEKAYLHKINGFIVEKPGDMWMRVALCIHGENIEKTIETYDYMSNLIFTHATPTLYNAGYNNAQMSSCFLLGTGDSINDIYYSLNQCAQISKWAGGIGMHIHDVRSQGANIREITNASTGIVPMLRVFNATARYVNQSSKRNGSIAIYLGMEHPDILDFLELRKNTGDEEMRCRDLFYAAWISDLFMERVKENGMWSLFCPKDVPGFNDVYGEEYKQKYIEAEIKQKYKKQIKAQDLWFLLLSAQIETGMPYMLYKDHINEKSNQKNVGVIKSSNLCCEITEYTSSDEVAVCNLASISLPQFYNYETKKFDFDKLKKVSMVVTENLNNVIDKNYYPVVEAKNSNLRHRPIGIGVQGLADIYIIMGYAFESPEANALNADIFETIYYGALCSSLELANKNGSYTTFSGSPLSKGQFQFDLWNVNPCERKYRRVQWDWDTLRTDIMKCGVYNSLLVAPMPTASTSQILGNNECIEPYTSNIYLRRTLAGEFVVVNKYLIQDLMKLGLWNKEMKNKIIEHNGSVQNISTIPDDLKKLYKTVWEISMKNIIDQAATRGPFVCQSQSMNLFMANPSFAKLSSMHFYAWTKGLKTGMYYLRSKPASNPLQFTIEKTEEACENCSG